MTESAPIALDAVWATYSSSSNTVSLGLHDNEVSADERVYLFWTTEDGMSHCAAHDEDSNEIGRLSLYNVNAEQLVILLFEVMCLRDRAAE